MVPEIDRLMDPEVRNGDVAAFTHHQTVDQFDVLRSNPLLVSTEQKLTPAQLDGVQQVLTRYHWSDGGCPYVVCQAAAGSSGAGWGL